jgi:hypothetical protein
LFGSGFDCAGVDAAPIIFGFNTLLLSGSLTPVRDIGTATAQIDGILTSPEQPARVRLQLPP